MSNFVVEFLPREDFSSRIKVISTKSLSLAEVPEINPDFFTHALSATDVSASPVSQKQK